MDTTTNESELAAAVRELTGVTRKLDELLRDEYPRRSEVERRFLTKLEQRKHITRMVIVAMFTVVGCYVFSIGAYSQCFVGDLQNPSICKAVPGYRERVDRAVEVDRIHQTQNAQIRALQRRVAAMQQR